MFDSSMIQNSPPQCIYNWHERQLRHCCSVVLTPGWSGHLPTQVIATRLSLRNLAWYHEWAPRASRTHFLLLPTMTVRWGWGDDQQHFSKTWWPNHSRLKSFSNELLEYDGTWDGEGPAHNHAKYGYAERYWTSDDWPQTKVGGTKQASFSKWIPG